MDVQGGTRPRSSYLRARCVIRKGGKLLRGDSHARFGSNFPIANRDGISGRGSQDTSTTRLFRSKQTRRASTGACRHAFSQKNRGAQVCTPLFRYLTVAQVLSCAFDFLDNFSRNCRVRVPRSKPHVSPASFPLRLLDLRQKKQKGAQICTPFC
jgi:hypothetical protein